MNIFKRVNVVEHAIKSLEEGSQERKIMELEVRLLEREKEAVFFRSRINRLEVQNDILERRINEKI